MLCLLSAGCFAAVSSSAPLPPFVPSLISKSFQVFTQRRQVKRTGDGRQKISPYTPRDTHPGPHITQPYNAMTKQRFTLNVRMFSCSSAEGGKFLCAPHVYVAAGFVTSHLVWKPIRILCTTQASVIWKVEASRRIYFSVK